MNYQTRITLDDTLLTATTKLADGNIGALTAILKLSAAAREVDPDSALQEFTPLFELDSYGIYSDRVWVLFKYICKQNETTTIGLLRAVQLGILPEADLQTAIDIENEGGGKKHSLNVTELLAKVRERLPNFKKSEPV